MPRNALFDAAVNRAHAYAKRLGVPPNDKDALYRGLELWYLKTRFAYRVPLENILDALLHHPETGHTYVWRGGEGGGWQKRAE